MSFPVFSSTRSASSDGISFKETVLTGLAPDGGLYVPSFIPKIEKDTWVRWKDAQSRGTLSFEDIAFDVMKLYIPHSEVQYSKLKQIIAQSYKRFRNSKVTPVVKLEKAKLSILELFHGPTFAFKDVALQFLGNLFEYFISQEEGKTITVLGATSGDTGSSAIEGLRGKKNVEVFILFPSGRVSPIQERQMTTVIDKNVHCVAVQGTFDDAQAIVKTLFRDLAFRSKVNLSAVNSINFARILAQIVYYFYAYLVLGQKISFSVPTGNFGDILAGFYAKEMGLPVENLIVATNENDILYRYFRTGNYSRPPKVSQTCAPSMDICVSSNFERYLYHMLEGDGDKLNKLMLNFEKSGVLNGKDIFSSNGRSLHENCCCHMKAERLSDSEIMTTIKTCFEENQYLLDPHSACGVGAVNKLELSLENEHIVCLACAHWGKFSAAVGKAIGKDALENLKFPEELEKLKDLPTKKETLEATPETIKTYILTTLL